LGKFTLKEFWKIHPKKNYNLKKKRKKKPSHHWSQLSTMSVLNYNQICKEYFWLLRWRIEDSCAHGGVFSRDQWCPWFCFSREDDFLAFSLSKRYAWHHFLTTSNLLGKVSLACHHHGSSVPNFTHIPNVTSYNLELQRKSWTFTFGQYVHVSQFCRGKPIYSKLSAI
jgi:hypothetical protein